MTRSETNLPAFNLCVVAAALAMVAVLIPVPSAIAQVLAPGAAAVGVARGGPAYVYGHEALFFNPANIALDDARGIEITTGRATLGAGGDLLQFRFYNEIFTSGRTITDEETRTLMSEWFGGADSGLLRSATVSAEAIPIAIIHRLGSTSLAYSVRIRSQSSVSLNGGWLDLLLSGIGTDRTIPLNGQVGAMSTTEFGVSYARTLGKNVAIGATPKVIFGNDFADARLESTATVTESSIVHEYDYAVRAAGGLSTDLIDRVDLFSSGVINGGSFSPSLMSAAGIGFGLDAGVSAGVSPSVRLSASLTDVGYVRWSDAAQTVRPSATSFTFDGLVLDIDRVRSDYGGDVAEYFISTVDSLASEAYKEVDREYTSFTTALPTTLHLGAAWRSANGRALLTGGTSAPIFASPVRPSTLPDVHVGAEYSIGGTVRVPVRAGILVGGSSAMTFSLGLGLHSPRFDLDLGVAATPRSDVMGAGARYMAAVSAITIRL
ncbi:MAG: hypothetical protein HKN13_04115 [Rhodothermales bacterium]|nr:hypothetical protein [Rhodothermales bacterium]